LLIASLNFPNAKPQPIVAAYLLTSMLTVIPYMRWRKAQHRNNPAERRDMQAVQE